jgi:hypothetical protein
MKVYGSNIDTANSDFNEIISAQIINKIPKVEQNKK